jgi:hypothetical protein
MRRTSRKHLHGEICRVKDDGYDQSMHQVTLNLYVRCS